LSKFEQNRHIQIWFNISFFIVSLAIVIFSLFCIIRNKKRFDVTDKIEGKLQDV